MNKIHLETIKSLWREVCNLTGFIGGGIIIRKNTDEIRVSWPCGTDTTKSTARVFQRNMTSPHYYRKDVTLPQSGSEGFLVLVEDYLTSPTDDAGKARYIEITLYYDDGNNITLIYPKCNRTIELSKRPLQLARQEAIEALKKRQKVKKALRYLCAIICAIGTALGYIFTREGVFLTLPFIALSFFGFRPLYVMIFDMDGDSNSEQIARDKRVFWMITILMGQVGIIYVAARAGMIVGMAVLGVVLSGVLFVVSDPYSI